MNHTNVAEFLDVAAQIAPEHSYLSTADTNLCFRDIKTQADRLARGFRQRGLLPGDRIALLLPNSSLLVVTLFAALKAGVVPVLLNAGAPSPEIAAALDAVDASTLVTDGSSDARAAEAARLARRSTQLLIGGSVDIPEGESLDSLMAGASEEPLSLPLAPDHPAVMLFTSGTTGRPKGAILSHGSLRYTASFLASTFWQLDSSDVVLMAAPNAHIFGLSLVLVACAAQARLHMLPRFEPRAFLDACDQEQVTFTAGVPQMARLMLSPLAESHSLRSLRTLMLGGDTVEPTLVKALEARYPLKVIVGYGMTEGVPITYTSTNMAHVPPGSVGRPPPETELRIVDESGGDVETGESGEILVRGPQMFQGYFGESTENAHYHGWFRTGDVGRLDQDGFLFHLDRLKNIVKTAGYTVFPTEVERILLSHPAISEVALVGRPHAAMGAILCAVVVPQPDMALVANEVVDYARTHLSAYKVPRRVIFVKQLPKTTAGKLDRRAISEMAIGP